MNAMLLRPLSLREIASFLVMTCLSGPAAEKAELMWS
jgi:hypothetical protein